MSFVIARRAVVAAAVLSAALVAAPALAHGPSRQKVVEKIEINAPVAKVWEIVGNFQDGSWIPGVTKTTGSGGSAADAKRTLTLKNGAINETLTKIDADGKSISYKIDDDLDVNVLPVKNYSSTITLKDAGGKTEVEWKGAFYRGFMNNDPPPELSDEAALKAVTGIYKSGLANLKARAEGK